MPFFMVTPKMIFTAVLHICSRYTSAKQDTAFLPLHYWGSWHVQGCSSSGEYTGSAVNSASLIVHSQRLYVKMPRSSILRDEMREKGNVGHLRSLHPCLYRILP